MNSNHCPTCGQSLPGTSLQCEEENVRAWAREIGIALIHGDLLRLEQASQYSGLAVQTLNNLASQDLVKFRKIRGRNYLPVEELAALVSERK